MNQEILTENNQSQNKNTVDYIEILSLLWKKRKSIILITLISGVVFTLLSFLITPTYLSTASILPEMDKGKLGPLGDLASLAGINIGGEVIMVKLYPDIIQSEAVLKPVIEKKYKSRFFDKPVNLYEYFDIEEETPRRTLEVALKTLRKKLDINLSAKTGLLTYSLETRDPEVTAEILNTITQELNNFLLTKRTTNAGEQKKWIEKRLKEVEEDLKKAENNLKEFRERNRRVSDSPQLLLEQERLVREVGIQTSIFTTLKQQYEVARIEEIKNVPIINVLDEAKPAAKKNNPKRRLFALFGLFLGFVISAGNVLFQSKYKPVIQEYLAIFKSNRK